MAELPTEHAWSKGSAIRYSRVDNDLAASEAGVTVGPTNDKAARGVQMVPAQCEHMHVRVNVTKDT